MQESTRPATTRRSNVATVLRVTSGNFLEMFDFFLFGFYATNISKTFFPLDSEFASLMLAFGTFGAGFLMRPLGAVILGAYVDRVGRRQGLIVTLSLMAAGTMLIALVPGFATIGLLAPFAVLIGRLLQGFSAGVELGGVSVYLSEMATPGHKGLYVSWQSASQQLAIVAAAALGFALNASMPPAALNAWGWRIPFLIGCLIVPFLFLIRRSLHETDAFLARTRRPDVHEILESLVEHWGIVVSGVMLVVMTTVSFYLITVYTPTFVRSVLKLSAADSLFVTLCVGLSNFFWLPVMGALSDKVGRRPILVAFALLTVLTSYWALSWLTAAPTLQRTLIVELWLSFLYASYNGAMVVALTEVMPVHVRTVGFSLAYSLATAIFGGFTPAASTWLIQVTGDKAAPGLWMAFSAVCGLIGTWALYRPASVKRRALEPV
ncbi:MAG TPA: MFS transporter [Vicinamibacterales bacterium]|nr:MFS transporter [Vicinamibacterales bacterium]